MWNVIQDSIGLFCGSKCFDRAYVLGKLQEGSTQQSASKLFFSREKLNWCKNCKYK